MGIIFCTDVESKDFLCVNATEKDFVNQNVEVAVLKLAREKENLCTVNKQAESLLRNMNIGLGWQTETINNISESALSGLQPLRVDADLDGHLLF